ncbi:MAG: diguanylate cyclase [Saccharospirillum sp.]|nr:diguanylate cyclase [Saccharospirillum sp.]
MNQSYPLRLLQNVWQQASEGQGQVLFFSDRTGARLATLVSSFQPKEEAHCYFYRLEADAGWLGYFPLIDILRDLYDEAGIQNCAAWLGGLDIHPANRPLWRFLLDDRYLQRQSFRLKEHVAQYCLRLEQDLAELLRALTLRKPIFLFIANFHYASPSLRHWLIRHRQSLNAALMVLTASDPGYARDDSRMDSRSETSQPEGPDDYPWLIDLPPDIDNTEDFDWQEAPAMTSQGIPNLLQFCIENHALACFSEAQSLCDGINLMLDERQINLIDDHRFELMLLEAETRFFLGNYNAATNQLTELVELARQQHQYHALFDAYFRLSWVALSKYRLADAEQMATHAQTALRQIPEKDAQWLLREREWLVQQAEIHGRQQRRLSSVHQQRLEALLPMAPDDDAHYLLRLAQAQWSQQLTQVERRYLDKALVSSLTRAKQQLHSSAVALLLDAIARFEVGRGRHDRAMRLLHLALRVCAPLRSIQHETTLLNTLGYVYLRQGKLLAARDTLAQTLGRLHQVSRYNDVAVTLHYLAWVYFCGGNLQASEQMLNAAYRLCRIRGFFYLTDFGRDDLLIHRALCRFYQGHSVEAQQLLNELHHRDAHLTIVGRLMIIALQLHLARAESDQHAIETLSQAGQTQLISAQNRLPQLQDLLLYASGGAVKVESPPGLIAWMQSADGHAEMTALPVDVMSLLRAAELEREVEQLQQRIRDTRLLSHLSAQANAASEANELMHTVCRQLSAHLDCNYAAIEILARPFMEPLFVHQGLSDEKADLLHQQLRLHKLTRGRLLINLTRLEMPEYEQGYVFVNSIALPHYDFGDLVLMTRNPNGFDESVLRTATLLTGQLAATLQRLTHEKELQRLSSTDMLTGLTNRQALYPRLEEELSRARRYEDYRFCLAFLDLDNFKYLNDSFGHHFGDRVLQGFARTLDHHSRTEDVVARLGGDEFVILFPNQSGSQVMTMVQRLLQVFETPESCRQTLKEYTGQYLDFDAENCLGCSVGIIEISSQKVPESVDHMLNQADQAMYRAKSGGKNQASLLDT